MIKMILFDVDGVFLSEERCFDASALAVWELLYAPHFLALPGEIYTPTPTEEQIKHIRELVFQDNQVLDWMKTRGVNSNWDMVFLTFSAQLMKILKEVHQHDPHFLHQLLSKPISEASIQQLRDWLKAHQIVFTVDFAAFSTLFDPQLRDRQSLLVYFNQLAEQWFAYSIDQFSRNSGLWRLGHSVYQEWYIGAQLYEETEQEKARNPEKQGFLEYEIPLAPPDQVQTMLTKLREKGIILGIGTGRPFIETKIPFEAMGLYSLFDAQRIVSASDVIQAEGEFPERAPLGKPGPYTYIKGYLGRSASDEECLTFDLPISDGSEILIVGDSVADFLAAREMGCTFAATLTGLTGKEARAKFEELQADYILEDVLELETLFTDRQ
ncbi:Phosphoglycolate phosphatase, HAD superfamily [Seinonella peptonophila]|uniref:Phosphoglycolate phosphatase, HAD superfamily n=1 Tax=Seinonella peptonophila TaxID=112248 RepID=A0A1M4VQG1_9BACL|nr:HAD hydrolase-like protein [Seinonella peptonophila]SHE71294.1 Phosphoglycolate phosphatase, HAD superfamily [Seinonella peptonophila]